VPESSRRGQRFIWHRGRNRLTGTRLKFNSFDYQGDAGTTLDTDGLDTDGELNAGLFFIGSAIFAIPPAPEEGHYVGQPLFA
jgi:hypothetical protein